MPARINNLVCGVFLDRDGTLIEDRGDLADQSQVVFFKDTITSLQSLCERFYLFMVTNQSGVTKGTISMQEAEGVNAYIESYLRGHGILFKATYVCPHARWSGCHCMKPSPYFLEKAAGDFGVDLGCSFVIGDHPHDVQLAINAGATGIYVLSGHGRKHSHDIPAGTTVAQGIKEATEIILER